jgi:hypothetical protein
VGQRVRDGRQQRGDRREEKGGYLGGEGSRRGSRVLSPVSSLPFELFLTH